MTNEIKYVTGDATKPIGVGSTRCILIVHITNDIHAWGSGFVMALSNKWSQPQNKYLTEPNTRRLGYTQFVDVEDYAKDDKQIYVANMTAQTGIGKLSGPPIRYDALRACLIQVRYWALLNGASIHMPRIGTERAGGDWKIIELIIEENLTAHDVPVVVYDYNGTRFK